MVQCKYKVVGVNKCLNIYFFSSLWGVLHQQFEIRCWQIESGILGLLLCTNLCGSWKRACVQSDSVFSVALGCFFDTYTFSYYRVHNYYSCYTSLSWHPHLIQAIHCFQMRKTAGSLCAVLSVWMQPHSLHKCLQSTPGSGFGKSAVKHKHVEEF